MKVIRVRNVSQALCAGLAYLLQQGATCSSRNGPVLRAPEPVTTVFMEPWRRVLLSPTRDANPFFHLFEVVWMLAGRQDAASVAYYSSNMLRFADESFAGPYMNGAYGWRWRRHFAYDQLQSIVEQLRNDPHSRRCVLQMWDASHDPSAAAKGSKDVPCNTSVAFDYVNGKLNMTVFNRSNDVVWGAYGANAVHMSYLHEYVASSAGLTQGVYYQVSNNYHVYTENEVVRRLMDFDRGRVSAEFMSDASQDPGLETVPLQVWSDDGFLQQCERTLREPNTGGSPVDYTYKPENAWLREVFQPMMRAFDSYKKDDLYEAYALMGGVGDLAWRRAGEEWIHRRIQRRASAALKAEGAAGEKGA